MRLAPTLLAAALATGACGRRVAPAASAAEPGAAPRPAELPDFVKLTRVEAVAEPTVTAATGKVSFDEERVSRVASPVAGRVTGLLAHPGDRVRRGEGLLVIASPDAQSALADYLAAVADEDVAKRALDRQRRLLADQAVSTKEVVQAESDAKKAAAALARAEARLDVLGIDPRSAAPRTSTFVLRAPIDGVVVERPAFPGMEVRPDSGTPLVTVADLSHLWVLADVYERDLSRVAAGQAAEVRVAADPARAFTGKVTHVGDLVDPGTHTVKVRVDVANPQLLLKPEMFARVTIEGTAPSERALTVPAGAVLSDGAASAVVIAGPGGKFEKRTVEVGPEQDGRVPILSGLKDGDQVVAEGALFLEAALEDR